jgi:hypothetical protein
MIKNCITHLKETKLDDNQLQQTMNLKTEFKMTLENLEGYELVNMLDADYSIDQTYVLLKFVDYEIYDKWIVCYQDDGQNLTLRIFESEDEIEAKAFYESHNKKKARIIINQSVIFKKDGD